MNKTKVSFNATVNFNTTKINTLLSEKINKAQIKLDIQVLKDSNYYCPMETSALQKSAIIGSVAGSGEIAWKTPYAKAQYYGVNFDHSKSDNPNATAKWFESAKARKMKQWENLVNDEIKRS